VSSVERVNTALFLTRPYRSDQCAVYVMDRELLVVGSNWTNCSSASFARSIIRNLPVITASQDDIIPVPAGSPLHKIKGTQQEDFLDCVGGKSQRWSEEEYREGKSRPTW
jgi:hypothetical protein